MSDHNFTSGTDTALPREDRQPTSPARRKVLLGSGAVVLLSACSGMNQRLVAGKSHNIAYMSDVHFHDVYANFADGSFKGLPSANGKNATIRTMRSQLTSTRLFNENYFAFVAALDDAVARGLKTVVISGDFSDDGQPVHLRGLQQVMERYRKEKGLDFFVTLGNHDPQRPYAIAAGKKDYLGVGGKEQPIFSKNGVPACTGYDQPWALRDGTICTPEVVHGGYEEIFQFMGRYGMMPQPEYLYWETPYSSYKEQANYNYEKAASEASLSRRSYEICKEGAGGAYKQPGYTLCSRLPDATYLVEPQPGLWLMAVDANVFIPEKSDGELGKRYSPSGNNAYNKMLTHKQHVLAWMKDVADRAKREGKTLSTFSHYPMIEFYRKASPEIAAIFGKGGLDLKREPTAATSAAMAALGLGVHFGGHIHANDTAIYKKDGKFLVNIQTPSLAAYVPAYKQVSYREGGKVEVQTIVIREVPRFNELFEHYRTEHRYLSQNAPDKLWDARILESRSYGEFAAWHIAELVRIRFLKEKWPADMRELVSGLNGAEMLTMALLDTPISEGQQIRLGYGAGKLAGCLGDETGAPDAAAKSRFEADWQAARGRAEKLAAANGLSLEALAKVRGLDMAIDFHRVLNAGELAFADLKPRAAVYRTMNQALRERSGELRLSAADAKKFSAQNPAGRIFQLRFKPFFQALAKAANSEPNRDFEIDLVNQSIRDFTNERLNVQ